MTKREHPHADYRGQPVTRRELLKRGAVVGVLTAVGAYLALAPEDFPLSRRDASGLRGLPKEKPFELPDFSVAKRAGADGGDGAHHNAACQQLPPGDELSAIVCVGMLALSQRPCAPGTAP